MKSDFLTPRNKVIAVLILLAALSRLLPHPFNFTPIGAIALFAGTFISNKKAAFILPITILLISDLFIELAGGVGFYPDMVFVYGSFLLITSLGFILRNHQQRQTILVASLVSSVLFFLITNFGAWLLYDMYPKNLEGLVASYVAGIPFFRGTVMGDLFYNFLLFGSYAVIRWRFPLAVIR